MKLTYITDYEYTHDEIGFILAFLEGKTKPISRQAVEQCQERGLKKLRKRFGHFADYLSPDFERDDCHIELADPRH